MDNIREWISDNLRYILLGVALILVLAIAVMGIRAISNIATGGAPAKTTEQQTESDTTNDVIVQDETEAAAQTSGSSLTKNDAKVLTTMTAYYEARSNGDTETLRKLNPSMDDQEEANILNSYVESYSDVSTYSRAGLTAGSYLVYVCYNGKVRDIDTLVPSLIECYLMTDESGGLYIADTDGNADIEAFCAQAQAEPEVQELISSVNKALEEAKNSDPALKEFMGKYGGSGGSQDEGDSKENGEGSEEADEVVALDTCNVRSTPNIEDGNIIGSLYPGERATKLGEADGWVEIDFNGESAYVSSDFVGTPEEAQEQNEADYFAPGAAE